MKPFAEDGSVPQITLSPGELYFSREPAIVRTLLGSCVAITLWHPRQRMGGMCHYLLTDRSHYKRNDNHPPGYYATDAIKYFLEQAKRSGCHPREFEVKLFGGGNMFDGIQARMSSINVAQVNVSEGHRLLEENGFSVKTADVGGVRYRKIYFELASGDVWVQYGRHSQTVISGEEI